MIVVDETEPDGGKSLPHFSAAPHLCRSPTISEPITDFFLSRVNKNTINAEVEPPFEPREVHIRRGQNVRDKFILEQEIGR
jgi:hypothetical protein